MKKIICAAMTLTLILLAACTAPTAENTATETDSMVATQTQAVSSVETAIEAATTADELRALVGQYKSEGNDEAVYLAALKLIELDPSDATAYADAAAALLALSGANIDEINRLLALGSENAQDVQTLAEWAQQNQPDFSISVPFAPDYASANEINTAGITTGNLTNAAKYNGGWIGGLLTWQGDWVYLSRPDENFAVYKMRADGSEYQRLGEDSGSSLNVIGDWLYYVNLSDGCKPYKIRTDGSMRTKLTDDNCGFLSVSGDWIYYCNFSDEGCLYKVKTDGSESVKLTDDMVIFPCVSGDSVYYYVKKDNGGLWRISVDGGDPQYLAEAGMYCVLGDWVYYVDSNNPYDIRRMHTDGSGDELVKSFDQPITTFNVTADTLCVGLGVGYEEDGFIISQEIATYDLATLTEKLRFQMDTEPLCTGPDGWSYFIKYSEGLIWFAMDENGAQQQIG
ncbi:MAG: DUF5050 domain-containing protein [Eubacteriales bacterium]|nr:DUF5050 domain-containing protein [Eubacteriales bacterium]